jgi:hypothetical protein
MIRSSPEMDRDEGGKKAPSYLKYGKLTSAKRKTAGDIDGSDIMIQELTVEV